MTEPEWDMTPEAINASLAEARHSPVEPQTLAAAITAGIQALIAAYAPSGGAAEPASADQ